MQTNNFVIGIGSQRAGSTLLNKVLDKCTDIYMHPLKEVHYFDTIFNIRSEVVLKDYARDQIDREIKKLIDTRDRGFFDKKHANYLRANWLLYSRRVEEIDYLDLFRPCVRDNKILGEITPEYMLLDDDQVKYMSSIVGKHAKIILLCRDPVDRFLSSYKLLKLYRNKDGNLKNAENEISEIIDNNGAWIKQQDALNDYNNSYVNFKKHFSDVAILKYEDMYKQPKKFKDFLSDFLGVAVDEDKLIECVSSKVNSLGEEFIISDGLREKLASRYQSQKEYYESIPNI